MSISMENYNWDELNNKAAELYPKIAYPSGEMSSEIMDKFAQMFTISPAIIATLNSNGLYKPS